MIIQINLKSSYRDRDFLFAVSKSPSPSNLVWSDNNSISIQTQGQYYCFAKSKRTGKISTIATVVNCNQTDVTCDLIALPPYNLGNCQIDFLPPYLLADCGIDGIEPYELDNQCELIGVIPYKLP